MRKLKNLIASRKYSLIFFIVLLTIVGLLQNILFEKVRKQNQEKKDYYSPMVEKAVKDFNEQYFKNISFKGELNDYISSFSHGKAYIVNLKLVYSDGIDALPSKYDFIKMNTKTNELSIMISGDIFYPAGDNENQYSLPYIGDFIEKRKGELYMRIIYKDKPDTATVRVDNQYPYFEKEVEQEHPYPEAK